MISVTDAQVTIRAHCAAMQCELVRLDVALGRVLARDVVSPGNLPMFDNSAMDGFALACAGCAVPAGREFVVRGEQAAGDGRRYAVARAACEIMTGAWIPDGLDAVVPIEQVEVVSRTAGGGALCIRLNAPVFPGQHVRRVGEDIECGALAAAVGSILGPQHIMLLSALGVAWVHVACRPRVAMLCTGRELIDDASQLLLPGQIRNASGPYLAACLHLGGAELVYRETIPDEADALAAAVTRALHAGAEIVLSTGAVSMGRYDFVPQTLQALGAELLFHRVAMRPGKPLLFARLAGGQLYFGLPGNPVSSAVGLRFFVEIALRAQLGLREESPWYLPLMHDVKKRAGVRLYQKAWLQLSADGQLRVSLVNGQESFKTQSLSQSNAWAVLSEDNDVLAKGASVPVFPLRQQVGDCFGEQMS
jgi:molybdopterin molybdotransferase